MSKLAALILQKAHLNVMVDFLNELVSGTPADQSGVKIDVLAELERLRSKIHAIDEAISREYEKS